MLLNWDGIISDIIALSDGDESIILATPITMLNDIFLLPLGGTTTGSCGMGAIPNIFNLLRAPLYYLPLFSVRAITVSSIFLYLTAVLFTACQLSLSLQIR